MLTKASLIEKLRQAGAIRVGFAPLAPVSDAARDHYLQWLAQGRHASMQYLEHHLPIRFNPALLLTPNQPSTPAASQASSLASQASPLASQTSPLASQASPLASQACRGAPAPEEGTIISMAFPYYSGQAKGSGGLLFARYALGDDYHEVLRRRLQPVAEAITAATGCPARICIDTAPIMERFWAIQAGLGYIGRHRQLIIPGIGSHIFLAEIVTTAPFPPDTPTSSPFPPPISEASQACRGAIHRGRAPKAPEKALSSDAAAIYRAPTSDSARMAPEEAFSAKPPVSPVHLSSEAGAASCSPVLLSSDAQAMHPCANCRRCIDACPNKALSVQGGLDANLCLSYLTIEHRGPIPAGIRIPAGRIYGCDLCLEACPHSRPNEPACSPALLSSDASPDAAAIYRAPTADDARQAPEKNAEEPLPEFLPSSEQLPEFLPRPEILALTLEEALNLTQERFSLLFRHSSIKRAKLLGLLRTAAAMRKA